MFIATTHLSSRKCKCLHLKNWGGGVYRDWDYSEFIHILQPASQKLCETLSLFLVLLYINFIIHQ